MARLDHSSYPIYKTPLYKPQRVLSISLYGFYIEYKRKAKVSNSYCISIEEENFCVFCVCLLIRCQIFICILK